MDEVKKSRNGSVNSQLYKSKEPRGPDRVVNEQHPLIIPHEDDIEKSFHVNEDGSMTVEMKVHLTIKEEEVLHWTTTISRSSLSKRTVYASISESGNTSPDSKNTVSKHSFSICEDETKEENHSVGAGKVLGFKDKQGCEGCTSKTGKAKTGFKRTPTPGPRRFKKKASVESVKTVTELGVQQNTVGHYSYVERMDNGETMEAYCVVRHNTSSSSSSSSNRPFPKPQKTASAGKDAHSSIKSSGVAEVLQIENNGMEVRETVMHIYESLGCYDNYYANEEYRTDYAPLEASIPTAESKPSTGSGPHSSSNDCDIDFSTSDALHRQKEEMLSLSSEPLNPVLQATNTLPPVTDTKTRTAISSQIHGTSKLRRSERRKVTKPSTIQKGSTSSSDKKQKGTVPIPSKHSKGSSPDNHSSSKKSLSSSEIAGNGQMRRDAEKPHLKTVRKGKSLPRKEEAMSANVQNVKSTPTQRQNRNKGSVKATGHNVITPNRKPQMKKSMSEVLQPQKPLLSGKETNKKPQSLNNISFPAKHLELNDSSRNPSRPDVHQYVENWLEKVSPDREPYAEDTVIAESQAQEKVTFQMGGDSEQDEKVDGCTNPDEQCPSPAESMMGSASYPATAQQHNEQFVRGVSVLNVKPHKSAEASTSAFNEPVSFTPKILSSKEKIKHVLQQLCLSVQPIKMTSDNDMIVMLEKVNSKPDFLTQVASVFGSSCNVFLSFLSVMILRDYMTGKQSRTTSEALIVMESLQKISTNNDREERWVSLTNLQSNASFQFKKCWKDFLSSRERLEREPQSPKVSQTELAPDVFEDQHSVVNELMEELNMPQDLRAEISSTIRHAKYFYPVEENAFIEETRNQSEQEPDKFENTDVKEIFQNVKEGSLEGNEYGEEKQALEEDEATIEDAGANEIDDNGCEVTEMGKEAEEGPGTEDKMGESGWRERKAEMAEKVEEEIKEKMMMKEKEEFEEVEIGDKELAEESEEGLTDEEGKGAREEETAEETDEREAAEESQEGGEVMEGTEETDEEDEKESVTEEMNGRNNNERQGDSEEDERGAETGQEEGGEREGQRCDEGDESSEVTETEKNKKTVERLGNKERDCIAGDSNLVQLEKANVDSKLPEPDTESLIKYSSEDQCEEDKGDGTDTVNELETDDRQEHFEERSSNLPHPVEISQELLDFINSALQSSSLIFTYDAQGNVRIEPDYTRVVNTKQTVIPKKRKDSSYGLKCLPSPSTSELSDYRPETSESGGYKTQESVDIATESEDASEKSFQVCRCKAETERPNSHLEAVSNSEALQNPHLKNEGSLSSSDSVHTASTEDLFCFNVVTSQKADAHFATEVTRCTALCLEKDSPDGVLIDHGRWLLKENHLIRKSPPLSVGMYGNADSTSVDTSQESTREDSPSHSKTQPNPLTAISSSELEELAKPQTPKCTYYNMPHGSDSDPFMDDCSLKSGKNTTSIGKGRGHRVSPTIDTSKTWANKNGSLSSFSSVEFKIPDRKVHPEGESAAVAQSRRTSRGGGHVLQAQDSQDTLHLKCSQYCPIL